MMNDDKDYEPTGEKDEESTESEGGGQTIMKVIGGKLGVQHEQEERVSRSFQIFRHCHQSTH